MQVAVCIDIGGETRQHAGGGVAWPTIAGQESMPPQKRWRRVKRNATPRAVEVDIRFDSFVPVVPSPRRLFFGQLRAWAWARLMTRPEERLLELSADFFRRSHKGARARDGTLAAIPSMSPAAI